MKAKTTSEQTYGSNVRGGWAWVLPNSVFDVPAIPSTQTDEDGLESKVVLSIREYFAIYPNRTIMPLALGTHSVAVFDSDLDDITAFKTMLDGNGLVDGGKDYTLDLPHVYYSLPLSRYDELREVSPLNQGVQDETTRDVL